jgi:uncharacterized membrane protein YecN with MAPEG domain
MLTPLYAGLLGLLYALLSGRVMWWRMRSGVLTGDGSGEAGLAMIRAHANFMEFVPISLVLILLIELGGGDPYWIHGLGGTLLAARVLHAIGMWRSTGVSFGRRAGAGLTLGVLVVASGVCLSLCCG